MLRDQLFLNQISRRRFLQGAAATTGLALGGLPLAARAAGDLTIGIVYVGAARRFRLEPGACRRGRRR